MADVSKEALGKAYKAGYALPGIEWPQDATDEQKTPGVHHCPFSPGDPQRDEWLKGLKDRLTGPKDDPAAIVKQIDAELNGGKA